MMIRIRTLLTGTLVVLTLFLLASPEANAWNDFGHKLIGRMVWKQLTEDERAKVIEVLKQHPHYEGFLAADRPEGIEPGEWVFMRASIWPDWVRPPQRFEGDLAADGRHKFHRSNWHYVNFPYKPGWRMLPDEPLDHPTNVLKQLAFIDRLLKGEESEDPGIAAGVTPEQNRAVRLAWMFHLIEDMHQPLHTAAMIDEERFPDGDHGGNKLAIRISAESEPERLHWVWDGMLGKDATVESLTEKQQTLENDPDLSAEKLAPYFERAEYRDWAAESYELATQYVYLDGELPVVMFNRFEDGFVQASDVPVYSPEHMESSRAVANKRAVLSARRLADKLRETVINQ